MRQSVAFAFVEARRNGEALHAYPGDRPKDLADAYAIQDEALALWSRKVGGWKVGKINPPESERLGANRLVGPIFADTIHHYNDTAPALPIYRDGFGAAEAEFMLKLAPQAGSLPQSNTDTMAWVSEIRIGIEVASSPYPGINTDGPCVTVSDHGNNAGIVLGAVVKPANWGELDEIMVETFIDGHSVGKASTASMLDGPFGAVRFALANFKSRGIAPQNGWWISTGAITGVHEIALGQSATARFAGLGEISVDIN